MGAQMTKELGVYNEEEKVCTPQGPQRFRYLNNDPRSATAGIKRTPIQVTCTPTNSKRRSSNLVEENKKSPLDDQIMKEESNDVRNGVKEVDDILNAGLNEKKGYLETDMDTLDACVNESPQNLIQLQEKPVVQLSDVRSPSLEIARTPVLVQCTPELFALHARIDSLSFYDLEVNNDESSSVTVDDLELNNDESSAVMADDDPSAIVSDDDTVCTRNNTSLKKWLVDVENNASNNSPNISFSNSPKTVAKKQKELNALKKKLFFTPDAKDIYKPKARTPLGNLQASQVDGSPQNIMRAKQWRNIQEERQRRGIVDTENTPPSLPPLSKVSSAPGKIVDRKRTKTLWDNENTMFI